MNTQQLIRDAHANAIDRGFYKCPECNGHIGIFPPCDHPGCYNHVSHPCETCGHIAGFCKSCNGTGIDPHKNIGELLFDIISELHKAIDAHRKDELSKSYFENPKIYIDKFLKFPEKCKKGFEDTIKNTFEDKIADAFIKLFEIAGYLKIAELKDICNVKVTNQGIFNDLIMIISWCVSIKECELLPGFSPMRFLNGMYSDMLFFCLIHNIDIESHILAKMAYNKTRPEKHGKEY